MTPLNKKHLLCDKQTKLMSPIVIPSAVLGSKSQLSENNFKYTGFLLFNVFLNYFFQSYSSLDKNSYT